ncbi:hypothetical protein FEM48_Zijuj05G0157700 [Ziziphus jujuba var. spinosa]|uniref:Uncharacterized protein n=1 Tax=Ziziphus jujuba var. spinosa TaxID=714518 RepID=A0A978VFP7_ZIZJJ|nr:hypothetical protein FEM48_Zijuj05G0157700 [Ziziphus jujuba var. spinosa]
MWNWKSKPTHNHSLSASMASSKWLRPEQNLGFFCMYRFIRFSQLLGLPLEYVAFSWCAISVSTLKSGLPLSLSLSLYIYIYIYFKFIYVFLVSKETRAAGVLENFAEGEKYAEHAIRKFARNRSPEIMPAINSFFTDPSRS